MSLNGETVVNCRLCLSLFCVLRRPIPYLNRFIERFLITVLCYLNLRRTSPMPFVLFSALPQEKQSLVRKAVIQIER